MGKAMFPERNILVMIKISLPDFCYDYSGKFRGKTHLAGFPCRKHWMEHTDYKSM